MRPSLSPDRPPARLIPALLCALIVGCAFGSAVPLAAVPFTDRLLRNEALWGDGQAEYAIYDAVEVRYGIPRSTEVRHIVVREDFAASEQVKADDWRVRGTYRVFKLNQIITVPTGTYRYDQGHSAFWRADTGDLIKFAHTTNDSCGLTYKQGNRTAGGHWRYRAFTYWEGMSEIERSVSPPDNALFYDELPFKLRLIDWDRVTTFTAPLIPSVIGSKADALEWGPATFSITRTERSWNINVTHPLGVDRFDFALAAPHGLLRWEKWDGGSLVQKHSVRLPYWDLNRPGDERRLQP